MLMEPKAPTVQRAKGVRIDVSQETIDQATRADSSHCMIADAIKEQVPGATTVSVDLQTIRWSDRKKGVRYVYLTPAEAQVALIKFDQGVEQAPFTFRLRPSQAHVVPIKANSRTQAESTGRATTTGKTKVKRTGTGQYVRSGGKQPPVAVLSDDPRRGRIRKFGLKNLAV
jgi:hypothetical protein